MTVSYDLRGKVAVVTGAGRGIGRSIVLQYAAAGADVVLVSRTREQLESVVREVKNLYPGPAVMVQPADITSTSDVDMLVDAVVSEFSRIDILVNNAGGNVKKPFLDLTEEEWDYVIDVNLKGAFLCCKKVGPVMLGQKYGKIINIASVGGILSITQSAAYCAGKGALIQLTRVLAAEWADHNIQVNAIAPGFIEVGLAAEAMEKVQGLKEDILRRTPQQRLGQAEEVAAAALFLASDASGYVTGSILTVDGGMSSFGV